MAADRCRRQGLPPYSGTNRLPRMFGFQAAGAAPIYWPKRKGGRLAGSESVRLIALNCCNPSNSFFFALFYDYS
jgi:hypothetical protein